MGDSGKKDKGKKILELRQKAILKPENLLPRKEAFRTQLSWKKFKLPSFSDSFYDNSMFEYLPCEEKKGSVSSDFLRKGAV